MTRKTNIGLVIWAKNLVGQPYGFGTCGYKATESLLQRKAEQYPSHYPEKRMGRYRQDIKAGAVVQDCVGLIKGYYWTREDGKQVYGLDGRPDKGANGMLAAASEKGAICDMPEIPGVNLHKTGHVGIFEGDGMVLEAKGFDYGVVRTKLADGKWTSWFQCPYIEYVNTHEGHDYSGGKPAEVDIPMNTLETDPDDAEYSRFWDGRLIKYTPGENLMRGLDVRAIQERLADLGFEPGDVDGLYGPRTLATVKAFQKAAGIQMDGIVGSVTHKALFSGEVLSR